MSDFRPQGWSGPIEKDDLLFLEHKAVAFCYIFFETIMKMKKILSLFLAALMLLTLVACTPNTEDPTGTHIQ